MPIESPTLTGKLVSVDLDLGTAFWEGFTPEPGNNEQKTEFSPQDACIADIDGILDAFMDGTSLSVPTEEHSETNLVDMGFHAYQKAKKGQVNKKIESFNERRLFVINNNKTGILYFLVDKPQTLRPESGKVALWGYDRTNDFHDAKRVPKKISGAFDTNTAFLYKVVPVHSTAELIDTANCAKDISDGTWFTSVVNRDPQSLSPDVDDPAAELLSERSIHLPEMAGRFMIAVYPLMGYAGVKGGRSVTKRGYQRATISFGPTKLFKGPMYKICSKDTFPPGTRIPDPTSTPVSGGSTTKLPVPIDASVIASGAPVDDFNCYDNSTMTYLDGPSPLFF
jgi:hypothetical protein